MSKIRAGNTILGNQFAPPFSVSSNVASGWMLRWNNTLKAFEAYDPDALKKESGFDSIQVYQEVANGTATGFTLDWAVQSKPSLIITINGVKQNQDAYTVLDPIGDSTTVMLSEAPLAGDIVEFLGLQATDPSDIIAFGPVTGDTGPQWMLPWVAPNKPSLIVTINGIKQQTTAYDIAYNTGLNGSVTTLLTFNGALQPNDEIEVIGIKDTNEIPSSPLDGVNLGGGDGALGLFKQIDVAGVRQIAVFKSIAAGDNITITENAGEEFYTIEAVIPTFTGVGTGISTLNLAADPIEVRPLSGGNQIALSIQGDGSILIDFQGNATTLGGTAATSFATTVADAVGMTGESLVSKGSAANDSTLRLKGIRGGAGGIMVTDIGTDLYISATSGQNYVSVTNSPYAATPADEIIGIRRTSTTTITLPAPATVPVGHRVIIKDEVTSWINPQNRGTNPININVAGGGTIDGVATLGVTANLGYVELYSNGTQYFVLGRRAT